MKQRTRSLLLALVLAVSGLTACTAPSSPIRDGETSEEHEAITMLSPFRNVSGFLDVLHETYPEVNVEVIPYSGKNMTSYVQAQLRAGDMPDIYFTSVYTPGREDLSDKLIDLSAYAFTDNYAEARLQDVNDNGSIYFLPSYFNCLGITYNKTLLERHGWTLPTSLNELKELAPQVEAAGCDLALTEIQLPGYGFQYLCNIMDTGYLNTPDGRQWQNDFLDGTATLADSPDMMACFSLLDQWREVGMLNANGDPNSDDNTRLKMAEGNTLFLLGASNTFTEEETTDEFGLMPYLSEDGSKNAYILNVTRYAGLNKKLEEPGNEQKLEDALHFMEVLSSLEGMQALNENYADTSLLPLKNYSVPEGSYYKAIEEDLNKGFTAPFIYAGWENLILPLGEAGIAYIKGERDLTELAQTFDESQSLLQENTSEVWTTATEKIPTDDCAELVGICFAKASGADLALVSKNKYYPGSTDLNLEGVSGDLFALPITDMEITAILPTGWRGNIETVTLTGQRVKELAEHGFDYDGHTYPYQLVLPEGFTIQEDATYTVVVCGVTDEVAAEGNLTDTGILGLEAAEEYLHQFTALSRKDIVWN